MKVLLSILMLGLLQMNCWAQGNSVFNIQEETQKIGRVASKFGQAINDNNADSLAVLFTENAHYAANNGSLLKGREQIHDSFEKWMVMPQTLTEDSSYVLNVTVKKELAYMLSYYSHHIDPPDAEPFTNEGYGLAVFERQKNGEWKIKAMT